MSLSSAYHTPTWVRFSLKAYSPPPKLKRSELKAADLPFMNMSSMLASLRGLFWRN
ncbi:hypothetical protein D3C86_1117330 [compost metagenome]